MGHVPKGIALPIGEFVEDSLHRLLSGNLRSGAMADPVEAVVDLLDQQIKRPAKDVRSLLSMETRKKEQFAELLLCGRQRDSDRRPGQPEDARGPISIGSRQVLRQVTSAADSDDGDLFPHGIPAVDAR